MRAKLKMLNQKRMPPTTFRSVYFLAKKVRAEPFWWKAIQKKITTANTSKRAVMRSLVCFGVSSSTGADVSFACLAVTSACLYNLRVQ